MAAKRPVLGLWLDSVDYTLLCHWMNEGRLPHLQTLFSSGFRARLESVPHSRAEVIQALAITGSSPQKLRYWGVHDYDPATCRVSFGGIYDYRHRPPFFALGPDFRVAAIDFPQFQFHDNIEGWQVRNWGCHSPMTPSDSRPANVSRQMDEEFGIPPLRVHDHAILQDAEDMKLLINDLRLGMEMRTQMIKTLMSRERWDFFHVNFADLHKAGHYLVPNPATEDVLGREDPWAPLRKLYEQMDHSIGRLWDRFGSSWNFALFSYEGIQEFSDEVQNTFLLADLLVRDSFHGQGAFVYEDSRRGPSPESQAGIINWVMEAWHLRRRPTRLQEWLQARFGSQTAASLDA